MTQTIDKTIKDMSESGFPGSRKVYVTGSRPDLRVPFREIELSPTQGRKGPEENLTAAGVRHQRPLHRPRRGH